MSILQCEMCRGKKKILSLGNLMQDCSSCNGIGYKKSKENPMKMEDKIDTTFNESGTEVKIIKRGRPSRSK